MTTRDNRPVTTAEDRFLDAMFAEERRARDGRMEQEGPEVSADVLARVLGDAEAVQAGFAAPLKTRENAAAMIPQRTGWLSQISAALGGWPAFAGLAAASVCGLWLGISPPDGLNDMATLFMEGGDTLLDPVSGFDLALGEG